MLMKSRRKELGYSMDDLVRKVKEAGLKPPGRSTFYLYERPTFTPYDPLVREAIAKALGLRLEDLYR